MIAKGTRISLKAGEVFLTEQRMRRILAVRDGRIFYSKGGDRNFSCTRGAFRAWISASLAKRFEDSAWH